MSIKNFVDEILLRFPDARIAFTPHRPTLEELAKIRAPMELHARQNYSPELRRFIEIFSGAHIPLSNFSELEDLVINMQNINETVTAPVPIIGTKEVIPVGMDIASIIVSRTNNEDPSYDLPLDYSKVLLEILKKRGFDFNKDYQSSLTVPSIFTRATVVE